MSKFLVFLSIFIPSLLIVAGLSMAGVAVRSLLASSQTLECFCPSCPETAFAQKGATSLGFISVDIQGAVKKPGIYQLETGQRVADLLATASGFAKDADRAYVAKTLNLATELKDQDKVYIPFLGEDQLFSSQVSGSENVIDQSNSNFISINQADSTKLQSLSGIGEAKAKAIIDNRPYTNLEELVSKGVLSEGLLTNLKGQLTL